MDGNIVTVIVINPGVNGLTLDFSLHLCRACFLAYFLIPLFSVNSFVVIGLFCLSFVNCFECSRLLKS